jgi:spore germination protein GerM
MTRRVAIGAIVGFMMLIGCAPRGQSHPTKIASREVPFQLVGPQGERTDRPAGATVSLFFLAPGGVTEIRRPIAGTATPTRALHELTVGPDASERDLGTTTALPSPASARLERVRSRTAEVLLTSGFRDGSIDGQPEALAQIVYTLTAFPEIESVRFAVDDRPVDVPLPDGSLTSRPVNRADYDSLVKPAPQ